MLRHPRVRAGFPLLLTAVALAGCANPEADGRAKAAAALEAIQGEWTVGSIERAGQKADPETLKLCHARITKDRFQFGDATQRGPLNEVNAEEFVIQLDPVKAAGNIDLVYPAGKEQGQTRRGVYALEGDQLTICWGETGQARPTGLVSQTDPPTLLVVLRRKQ